MKDTHKLQDKKEQQLREIARIEGLPRAKRWKAAQQFTLANSSVARFEHQETVKEVAELREGIKNDFAVSDGGWRHGLRIPMSIMVGLELFDPDLKEDSRKDKDAQQKELKSLIKVFPEYAIPRRF